MDIPSSTSASTSFRDNYEWVKEFADWNKFDAVASLGVIHKVSLDSIFPLYHSAKHSFHFRGTANTPRAFSTRTCPSTTRIRNTASWREERCTPTVGPISWCGWFF